MVFGCAGGETEEATDDQPSKDIHAVVINTQNVEFMKAVGARRLLSIRVTT